MIANRRGDQLFIVRQVDHARLAGDLARQWGNDEFEAPTPRESVLLATDRHDDGWLDWDARPVLDPKTHRPYQFYSMPAGEHLEFYLRGVNGVIAVDRYAGLLVNLHCAGLYRLRFGVHPDILPHAHPPEVERVIQAYLARLDEQRASLEKEVLGDPPWDEANLWANYKRLQIWDRMSLFVCMPPRGEIELRSAPRDRERVETLRAYQTSDDVIAVAPYPFREESFELSAPAWLAPDREYHDDAEFRAALRDAEPTSIRVRVVKTNDA